MQLRSHLFLSLWTILCSVVGCANDSGGPASSNTVVLQGGSTAKSSSDSERGGTKATSDDAEAVGGTSASKKTGSGGTSSGTKSTTVGGSGAKGGSGNASTKGGATNSVSNAGRSNGGASSANSSKTSGAGASATGTNAAGGMDAAGGESAGGASSCSWESAPQSSNGELTCYWFGQGTPNNFVDECPNGFKTSCGYCGSETGKKDQANPYPCAIGEVTNAVEHIPTEHFVAFPDNARGDYCGMCVEVTYRGVTITATVIDYCASCQTAGHIDLSLSAAEALGMVEWNGNPKSGITWKVVGCPATEDIFVSYNGGKQTRQAYFKNLAFPIKSAKFEGTEATLNTGFWDFGAEVAGKTVTLTDVLGHTIEGTMPSKLPGGSFGAQFPLTCE